MGKFKITHGEEGKMYNRYDKSISLRKRAEKSLPAGVSSNFRAWEKPTTIFIEKAKGSHIWDVDGNEYIDYKMGFGPIILGHAYPKVQEAVKKNIDNGTIFAFSHEREVEVVEKIKKMCKHIELFRFTNSGTEATMHAIRLARAYTGKEKIIKFEGHYHGLYNEALISVHPSIEDIGIEINPNPIPYGSGVPKSVMDLVITQSWNQFEILERKVKQEANNIAAIITEPVMLNTGVILPKEGYLKFLRDVCDKYGIVLIFDEVKGGFRIAKGGAAEYYNVKPD